MDVLNIKGLKKSFGDKVVLKGLDLCVPEQSIFGFVGRNGAGKTTTMKSVLGLLKPDDGEIYVCGEKATYGQTSTNRFVGYLPDVPEFYPFMTAKEYLKLCGESLNMSSKDIEGRSNELLRLVGLGDERHRIKGYSRGMKQRLGIAQALLASPKLLICDEPTSALDPIGRKDILDILLSVKDQTTVLFSTHILSDVERICTEVAVLNEGTLAMQGTVAQLKSEHCSDGFIVEVQDESDASKLVEAFSSVVRNEDNELRFVGTDELMFEVMSFISANRIAVGRIEKQEPSLEALVREVVSK